MCPLKLFLYQNKIELEKFFYILDLRYSLSTPCVSIILLFIFNNSVAFKFSYYKNNFTIIRTYSSKKHNKRYINYQGYSTKTVFCTLYRSDTVDRKWIYCGIFFLFFDFFLTVPKLLT